MHKQSKAVFENDNKVTSDFDHFQCESKFDWLFIFKRLAQLVVLRWAVCIACDWRALSYLIFINCFVVATWQKLSTDARKQT